MAITLPGRALVTWCIFAAFGGVVSFAYELWARHHYAGKGAPRPLSALEASCLADDGPRRDRGMLVDAGVPPHSGRTAGRADVTHA
jgi:hypothetical protein